MSRSNIVIIGALLIGLPLGLGAYTFAYAKGYSYLTNDPAQCANCHVMQDHFTAWQRGSHRAVATCGDCHTPPGLVPKYMTKARNGFWHSYYFTMGGYHNPIRITPRDLAITELACRKCHTEMTASIDPAHGATGRRGVSCTNCHAEVGHIE
jgi:cytochrome c nitrite reductase small subunit